MRSSSGRWRSARSRPCRVATAHPRAYRVVVPATLAVRIVTASCPFGPPDLRLSRCRQDRTSTSTPNGPAVADQLALHAALVDFATRLTQPYDLDEVLHDISDRAAQVLELDGGAGLTIGPDPAAGEMNFVTATNEATAL